MFLRNLRMVTLQSMDILIREFKVRFLNKAIDLNFENYFEILDNLKSGLVAQCSEYITREPSLEAFQNLTEMSYKN